MNKLTISVIIVLLVAGGFYFFAGQDAGEYIGQRADSGSSSSKGDSGSSVKSSDFGSGSNLESGTLPVDRAGEGFRDEEDQPAAQVYKTADEALAAVQNGAKDYDDIILEQFVEPGEDCTWCASFYDSLTSLMKQEDISEDDRAYYSEILAISGKSENIKTLIDAIEEAGETESADIYAESLELTIGGDDTVELLAQHLESENELLQESSVAAITNQGSRLAAETLYEHTKKMGDPDGYYSLGIGIAEMIPDQETLPYLQELASQRDEYSHLSFKALLNYGHEGLVKAFDVLVTSPNAEFDKQLILDAADHASFEEASEPYLNEMIKTHGDKQVVVDLANEIKEIFTLDEELDYEELDEEEIE